MQLDTIQSELTRLQIHPVNLAASAGDGRLVTLEGSLLKYWNMPATVNGQWLLEALQALPDAAGPEQVMKSLAATPPGNAI